MPRSPIIREAQRDELSALSALALRSKAVWGYSAQFLESCRAELTVSETELGEVFVLCSGETPLGFYSLQRLDGDRVELGYLFVEPVELGKGWGRRLVADACRRALRLGYRTLVIQGDPNAEDFYLHMGALKTGQRPSDSIPGRMLPTFELAL